MVTIDKKLEEQNLKIQDLTAYEQIKEEIVTNNEKWKYQVCKVMAMQIEEDTKRLRHGKILEFRTDIPYTDCEYSKVFSD